MKTKHFFLAVALCSVALTHAQWVNEDDFNQYPNSAFDRYWATSFYLHGDSLLAFVNIDEYGIVSDERLSCMGVYSPHTGALLDAVVLPNTDPSTGLNLNDWYALDIGLLNNKLRGGSGYWERELEFYDYDLNKVAGIPDFSSYVPNEADSAFASISFDTLYWIYPNGTKRYFTDLGRFKDTVESIYGDTNYRASWDIFPITYNHRVYLSFYMHLKDYSDKSDVGYIIELDTNAHVLNVREFPQGGLITVNDGGIFALGWDIDTAGVVFNILRGHSLDSLYHAYIIPQSYIEWFESTPSWRWSIYVKEYNEYVSIVLYENHIDTANWGNTKQKARAILYDPSGNEVYNFIVEGEKSPIGYMPRFTILDDSLNCYISMTDMNDQILFLAKIGPDGSLGHNETGYRASHTGLEISPNPAKGHIGVQHGLHGKVRYKVYNSAGKVFLNGNMPVNSKIDVETLAAGNYWLLVFDGASMLQPKPFVKE